MLERVNSGSLNTEYIDNNVIEIEFKGSMQES